MTILFGEEADRKFELVRHRGLLVDIYIYRRTQMAAGQRYVTTPFKVTV